MSRTKCVQKYHIVHFHGAVIWVRKLGRFPGFSDWVTAKRSMTVDGVALTGNIVIMRQGGPAIFERRDSGNIAHHPSIDHIVSHFSSCVSHHDVRKSES
jgi:hypothetical protein